MEGEEASGDVLRNVLTPEDLRLREVYGEWVHGNPGTHLDGGFADDSAWQAWWRDLAAPLLPRVSLASDDACPSGSGARRWCTAPDTDRTRSCGPPDSSHTAWSCTTTGAYIRSRRRWQDTPVVLVPWWLPPAPSPPPSPFPPPQSSLRRAQVLYCHLRLCVPLLLEGHKMTLRL